MPTVSAWNIEHTSAGSQQQVFLKKIDFLARFLMRHRGPDLEREATKQRLVPINSYRSSPSSGTLASA